jgi:hypothetical protein
MLVACRQSALETHYEDVKAVTQAMAVGVGRRTRSRRERALAQRRAAPEAYGDWLAGTENDATVVPFAQAAG